MDAKQIAERHIVERYLANQLTDAEAEAFEAYVEAHPEMVREIEVATRMKSGLATLRQRGELDTVLRAERRKGLRRPALIAASVALVLFAGAYFARQWTVAPHTPLLATTARELLGPDDQPLAIGARLFIARTRAGLVESLPRPAPGDLVELRLDLHATAPSSKYSVQLLRVSGAALEDVGSLSEATAQADGSLSFFVRGSALGEGNYLVRVAGSDPSEPVEFALRITPTTP